ncbi:MAG: 30S ribosomal protein S19e [Candidatus Methanoperedens sp.]|nr:30S ribosomal protein S19e [Candidatus Methanoperedens sp.]MCZ7361520.1 30S ribosomal protein S19e [Candidatus Methanoperedens sp.]HLB70462.1 30S ribosomal protein S19e [Candidatus Methanoperedens sp.]
MTTVYDVPAEMLINSAALKLKNDQKVNPPEWAKFAKTGAHKELSPDNVDWWYVRCASILRRVYIDGPVGISRIRSFYGGRHRNGVTPVHFSKGSGSIAREALQQLEKAGFVKAQKSGRIISPQGRSFLDNTANEVKAEVIKINPAMAKY